MKSFSAPTSMTAWVQRFTDTLTYLQTDAKKDISAWTLSSARGSTDNLLQCIAKLDELSIWIVEHVVAVEERVKHERKVEMSDISAKKEQGQPKRVHGGSV